MSQLASRATKLALLFFITLAIYGCGAVDDDFTSNAGATGPSANSSAQILARLGPAVQVPNVDAGEFTRMPFHGFKAITPDGTKVLFLAKDANGIFQLYLRDLTENVTERISESAAGVAGDGDTTYGALSNDGNIVVFASESSNLAPTPNPDKLSQVYVRNRAADSTEYADTRAPGTTGLRNVDTPDDLAGDSIRPSISGDGSRVVFESRNPTLTNDDIIETLPSGNQAARARILMVNLDTVEDNPGTVISTREIRAQTLGGISTVVDAFTTADLEGNVGRVIGDRSSQNPDISRDGRWVVFNSLATNFDSEFDSRGNRQIYRVDLNASSPDPKLISFEGDTAGDGHSYNPTVNADGSVVAYETLATNLAAGAAPDRIFKVLAWRSSGTTLVSSKETDSYLASVSDDGNYVGFVSKALDLVNPPLEETTVGPTPNLRTFVHRLDTGLTAVVGRTETAIGNGTDVLGTPEELQALNSETGACEGDTAISGDGSVIAYTSFSTNLGPEITGQETANQSVFVSPNPLFGGTINFTQQPTNLGDGQVFNPTVQVEIRNDFGQVDTSFTGPVTLTLSGAGDPALSGTTTVNAVAGVANFPGVGVTGVGATALTLTATGGGDVGFEAVTSTAFDFTNEALVATSIVFGTQPQDAPQDIRFAAPVTVQVLDQNNNVLALDNTTTITLELNDPFDTMAMSGDLPGGIAAQIIVMPGAATLSGTLSRTTVAGVATFDDLSVDFQNFNYSLTATATGTPTALPDVTSSFFDITPEIGAPLFVADQLNDTLGVRFTTGFGLAADPQRPNIALPARATDLVNHNGQLLVAMGGDGTQNGNASQLALLNETTGAVLDSVSLGTSEVNNQFKILFDPNFSQALVFDQQKSQVRGFRIVGDTLEEYDPANGMIGSMPFALDGVNPVAVAASFDYAVIANADNTVSVYSLDFQNFFLTPVMGSPFTIPAAPSRAPSQIALADGENLGVYITSPGSNEILRGLVGLGDGQYSFVEAIAVGGSPNAIARIGFTFPQILYVGTDTIVEAFEVNGLSGTLTSLGFTPSLGTNPQSIIQGFIPENSPGFPTGSDVLYMSTNEGFSGFPLTNNVPQPGTAFPGNLGNDAVNIDDGGVMEFQTFVIID